MTHSRGRTHEIEGLVASHNRNVAPAENRLRQFDACPELGRAAAHHQSTQQIHKAALHPTLNLRRQIAPLGVQNKVFQFVRRLKMHGHHSKRLVILIIPQKRKIASLIFRYYPSRELYISD